MPLRVVLATLLVTSSMIVAAAAEPRGLLIINADVWDGRSDSTRDNVEVFIRGNTIAAVGTDIDVPAGTRRIDAGGRFLMPGIIEAHAHLTLPLPIGETLDADPGYVAALSARAAQIYLLRGWTTVRDMGGPSTGLARAIDEGHIAGPRIYSAAAFISQTSGHGDFRGFNDPHPGLLSTGNDVAARYSRLADGPAEVRRATRESLRAGATAIKVMAGGGVSSAYDPIDTVQFSEEELRAAVESAADWGTYVAVHAYTDAAVLRAMDAGVRVIEHGHLLSDAVLRRMRKDGVMLSSQSFGGVRALELPADTEFGRKALQILDGVDGLMSRAAALGVPVAFGTDAFGSLNAIENGVREFGYRQRWFSSAEILRQATSGNAALLALTGRRNPYRDGPLGVIEPGAYADLLVVDGNPLEDVRILEDHERAIRLIVKDGTIYKDTL